LPTGWEQLGCGFRKGKQRVAFLGTPGSKIKFQYIPHFIEIAATSTTTQEQQHNILETKLAQQ
jgi:hypothetical protein